MDQQSDTEMEELMRETGDNLGYTRKDRNVRRRRAPLDLKSHWKTLALVGAGLVIFIAIMGMIFGHGNEASEEDFASVRQRLDRIEDKLSLIKGIEDRIARLEKQEKQLQQSVGKAAKSGRSLIRRLDRLSRNLDKLQKRAVPVTAKSRGSARKKAVSSNKRIYYNVKKGDSIYRVAEQYGMSVDELCSLNRMNQNQVIHPGQKLLVSPGHRE